MEKALLFSTSMWYPIYYLIMLKTSGSTKDLMSKSGRLNKINNRSFLSLVL